MSMLDRSEWYDIGRKTNWTPKYVTEDELFPEEQSGSFGLSLKDFSSYDEPYKISYSEYVDVQRQKDHGAYSVKAALERSDMYEKADAGWINTLKLHYGGVSVVEYHAGIMESRFVRFSKAPGMRNMGTFGMLDETRHGQIQLYFGHEHISKSRQFDWTNKCMRTNNWGAIIARSYFEDTLLLRDVVSNAIMSNFAFETGFTNLQFIGLSADAANMNDFSFAKLIQSIQSDEARHAQIGTPLLKILIEKGKKEEAQKLVDISFWRSWKLFAILTGMPMDYYLPLDKREGSFKEFMQEWIIAQFERGLLDIGLDKPWYWDTFLEDLDEEHHGQHLGTYSWRPTLWWNPASGMGPDERDWLEEKYPGWNDTFGKCWDVIIDNMKKDNWDSTVPGTLPVMCNVSHNPIVGIPWKGLRTESLVYKGRRYNFGSTVDKWVFEQDPERYASGQTITDRLVGGLIDPPDLGGVLKYMGLGVVSDPADDAHDYSWVEKFSDVRMTS